MYYRINVRRAFSGQLPYVLETHTEKVEHDADKLALKLAEKYCKYRDPLKMKHSNGWEYLTFTDFSVRVEKEHDDDLRYDRDGYILF